MSDDNKPVGVQFSIGKTSSLDLQDWAKNQTSPISKAIKEALEHFVRVYGTADISSSEVRNKLSSQSAISVSHKPVEVTNHSDPQPVEKENLTTNENEQNNSKKVISRGKIDVT